MGASESAIVRKPLNPSFALIPVVKCIDRFRLEHISAKVPVRNICNGAYAFTEPFELSGAPWNLFVTATQDNRLVLCPNNLGMRNVEARFIGVVMDNQGRVRHVFKSCHTFPKLPENHTTTALSARIPNQNLCESSVALDPTNCLDEDGCLTIRAYVLWPSQQFPLFDEHDVNDTPKCVEDKQNSQLSITTNRTFWLRFCCVGVAIAQAIPSASFDVVGIIAAYCGREPRAWFLRALGSHGRGHTQFCNPTEVVTTKDKEIIVLDSHGVRAFSQQGRVLRHLHHTSTERRLLPSRLSNLRVDERDTVYVYDHNIDGFRVAKHPRAPVMCPQADQQALELLVCCGNRVLVLQGETRRLAREFGQEVLLQANYCTVSKEGAYYVSDAKTHKVHMFDQQGNQTGSFGGGPGKREGRFNGPAGIACDSNTKRVFVCDRVNDRVQVFSPSGEFLFSFGSKGSGPGQLSKPCGVHVDGDGFIYVAEKGNHRVSVFMQ